MPKLLLLVPCEKPLVGADNSLSLINVIHSIRLELGSTDDLDETAKSQLHHEWTVVSIWQREPGDEGQRFEQRMTMTDSLGRVRARGLTEFELPKDYHRLFGKIRGFPGDAVEGEYTVSISIRNTKTQDWIDKGTFPIGVEIRKPATHPKQ